MCSSSIDLEICRPSEDHNWKQIFFSNSSSASVVMHLRMNTVPKGLCTAVVSAKEEKFYLEWSTIFSEPFPWSGAIIPFYDVASENTKVTIPRGIWSPRLSCKHRIQSPPLSQCCRLWYRVSVLLSRGRKPKVQYSKSQPSFPLKKKTFCYIGRAA